MDEKNNSNAEQNNKPLSSSTNTLTPNTAGALCYLLGFITGIFFFVTSKDRCVRFHALQSTMVFGIGFVLSLIPFVGILVGLSMLVLWVLLMVKAYKGEKYKLPILGDIAEKNA